MSRAAVLLIACLAFVFAAGCGSDGDAGVTNAEPRRESEPRDERPPQRPPAQSSSPQVEPSRCPAGVPECREAEGRIVYVERVDPDGDGDAHFVIVDPQGITLPGLTAIDVRKGLRPQPLPSPGDLISAAGPVQTGSYGQSQIHALELHVAN
jgi:hypothetical protein